MVGLDELGTAIMHVQSAFLAGDMVIKQNKGWAIVAVANSEDAEMVTSVLGDYVAAQRDMDAKPVAAGE